MAWVQTDIDALKASIATGALEVEYADGRRVKYRSLTEMIRLLSIMEAEVAGSTSSPRQTFAEFTRD
jgi:hypothetical protein